MDPSEFFTLSRSATPASYGPASKQPSSAQLLFRPAAAPSPATSPLRRPIWRRRPPRAEPGLAGVWGGTPRGTALPLGVQAGDGSVPCAPRP
jgi:hypothetical protein